MQGKMSGKSDSILTLRRGIATGFGLLGLLAVGLSVHIDPGPTASDTHLLVSDVGWNSTKSGVVD
jgi:hypothetical protein